MNFTNQKFKLIKDEIYFKKENILHIIYISVSMYINKLNVIIMIKSFF